MTYRERLQKEEPNKVGPVYEGGCAGCPKDYWDDALEPCPYKNNTVRNCQECWNREIPEKEDSADIKPAPTIKDSGTRREFETGAVRDIQEGKGRCDLMPLDIVALYLNTDDVSVFHWLSKFQETGDKGYLYTAIEICSIFPDPYTMILEVAKHFEDGAKKYGEYNWQKGIPVRCYIDSAVRHYLKHLRGDTDERHDRAFVWNILCAIWTCVHKPELNDYPLDGGENNKAV